MAARPRVLHLIDQPAAARGADCAPDPDAALLACLLLRERVTEVEQSVCLIGGNALEARARGVGLPATDRIAPPMGWTRRADRGVRSLFKDRGAPDVVHCWSRTTARLAARLGVPSCVTALDDHGAEGSEGVSILVRPSGGRLASRRDEQGAGLIGAPAPRLDLTGHAAGMAEAGAERELPAVLLLGGAPGEADAVRLVFLAGLLRVASEAAAWVIPSSSARLDRAQRFHARSGRLFRLIVADGPLAEQAREADIAVWLGGMWEESAAVGPSPGAAAVIGAVLAAGVPVVAPRSARTTPLYSPEAAEACLAFNATLAEMGRVLMPLIGDARARSRARDAAGRSAQAHAVGGPTFEGAVAEAWRTCHASPRASYAGSP